MVKVAIFDSGLGSLSIIKAIQRVCKIEIVYFADQKNFPYGEKSKSELETIIKKSIGLLERNFFPDLVVIASNTPTLMIKIVNSKVIGVNPPIQDAMKLSKTKKVAILGTKSAIESKSLTRYIKKFKFPSNNKVYQINSSILVNLVESGKFKTDKQYCKKIIREVLSKFFSDETIDVATLSSTHLTFLRSLLNSEFSHVKFIDPADMVAKKIVERIKNNNLERNTIKIYTSGNVDDFAKKLRMIGIKNKVNFLTI